MPTPQNSKLQQIFKRQKLLSQEVLMYQRVMEGMRKGLSFDSLLKLFVTVVRKGLGFKRAGIFLIEPDGKHVVLAMGTAANGNFEKNKDRLPLTSRRGATHFYDVLNGYKKYFLSNNISSRIPKKIHFRVRVRNNAIVPVEVGKKRIIGALAVDNLHVNRPITKSDVASLTNYATQMGLAIDSFRAHEKTVSLSLTDSMTNLYNRRYFDRALSQEIRRCQRYGRSFSLLLIDIDRFKRINDTYGHGVGDVVIRQVAALLRGNLRGLDVVARVGGEEFGVILPETPPQNLSMVVKRLLREMRETIPQAPILAERGENVTFSVGQVTFKEGNASAHGMMKRADKSLYDAKHKGRDRVGALQVIQNKG